MLFLHVFLQYQDAQYHSSIVLLVYFLYYILISLLFMCISTCFDTVYIFMAMSTSRGLRKGVSPLEGSAIPLLLFVFLLMYYVWLNKLIDSDSYCFVPFHSPFPRSLSLSLPSPFLSVPLSFPSSHYFRLLPSPSLSLFFPPTLSLSFSPLTLSFSPSLFFSLPLYPPSLLSLYLPLSLFLSTYSEVSLWKVYHVISGNSAKPPLNLIHQST